jgi:hypothetical protein
MSRLVKGVIHLVNGKNESLGIWSAKNKKSRSFCDFY